MELAEFDLAVADLEVRLERLRALYQQYFLGFERMIPSIPHKDVERRFQRMRKVQVRNTARKYKLQTLIQRYNTLQQYWRKTCREIENGTYVRQIQRAERRAFGPEERLEDVETAALRAVRATTDAERDMAALIAQRNPLPADAATPGPPPLPPRRRRPGDWSSLMPPGAAPAQSGGLSDARVAQLHRQLVEQKRKLKQDPDTSAEKLAAKLRAAEKKLREKHKGKTVDFKIVVKDGKPIVKPVLR